MEQSNDASFARVEQSLSNISTWLTDNCMMTDRVEHGNRTHDTTSIVQSVPTTSSVITTDYYTDCLDYRARGHETSGIITTRSQDGACSQQSYCDMETDGGGWTVFQRHQSDAVLFNLRWAEYKNGFGDLNDSFWWGNEKLAQALNDGRQYELGIALFDWEGEHRFAKYRHFYVAPESDNYRIRVSGYSGNAGADSFGPHTNGDQFFTVDRVNDIDALSSDCLARWGGGGFWYGNGCGAFSPNGRYSRTSSVPWFSGLHWRGWRGGDYSLKAVSLAFRATTN